jgi:hypothetical protein
MVEMRRQGRRCFLQRARQVIAHLRHPEVGYRTLICRPHSDRDDTPDPSSFQSSGQDRSELVGIEVRPCHLGVVTN